MLLRLHLHQFNYLPAYFHALGERHLDMLEEPFLNLDTQASLGLSRNLPSIGRQLEENRTAYLSHISAKLPALLKASMERHADVIVLPEYSVPAEVMPLLLDTLASSDWDGILIAGSHEVSGETLDLYANLFENATPPRHRLAISPAFERFESMTHSSFVTKANYSQYDTHLVLESSKTHKLSGRFPGVSWCICMDGITDAEEIVKREDTRLLIATCLSPSTAEFVQQAAALRIHRCLFAFCNIAHFGGTSLRVPLEFPVKRGAEGLHYLEVPRGVEAILEAEVDLDGGATMPGTNEVRPPVRFQRIVPIEYATRAAGFTLKALRTEVGAALDRGQSSAARSLIEAALKATPKQNHFVEDRLHQAVEILTDRPSDGDVARRLMDAIILPSLVPTDDMIRTNVASSLEAVAQAWKQSGASVHASDLAQASIALASEADRLGPFTHSIGLSRGLPYSDNELALLRDRLKAQRTLKERVVASDGVGALVITGTPGVGKRSLAAMCFRDMLPDWTYSWVTITEDCDAASLLFKIGVALGDESELDNLSSLTISEFKARCGALSAKLFALNRHAIIVGDAGDLNYSRDNYLKYNELLLEFGSRKGLARFVVTSSASRMLFRRVASVVSELRLEGLEDDHARDLWNFELRSRNPGAIVPELPTTVIRRLRGNPMLLKLAASMAADGIDIERAVEPKTAADLRAFKRLVAPIVDRLGRQGSEVLEAAALFSVFRDMVHRRRFERLDSSPRSQDVALLIIKGVLDAHGEFVEMHPLVRRYFAEELGEDLERQQRLHRVAVAYYRLTISECASTDTHGRLNAALEALYHATEGDDLGSVLDLTPGSLTEIAAAGRAAYDRRDFELARKAFAFLAEHPQATNRSELKSWVGRCLGHLDDPARDDWFADALGSATTESEKGLVRLQWASLQAAKGQLMAAKANLEAAAGTPTVFDPLYQALEVKVRAELGETILPADFAQSVFARTGLAHAQRFADRYAIDDATPESDDIPVPDSYPGAMVDLEFLAISTRDRG